ncbi:molybdenum cofactor guanylyltransferase [Phyllobacterium sp. CL33Tsu]|uniref:molybdenum cofactor guanylyltransferase MobA n=1 Tax=Phyllobacterium sp. CL33Tsu TaxID=1798191 RepID=UPI0008F1775A|nr:molybdenum cofactor guanylyltransferase MobA [Phyllobacterium sp. CL33Tsu]SFI98440.1 molybdenum cofactor guanylyltransferase [Phyllobacterium sp. CL33Tsu]
MRIAGIILAGGQSRRMNGRDKAMLPFGDRRLIDHVHERLSRQVETIALNSNADTAGFADLNVPVIADDIHGFAGPLAGIHAGMEWAAAQPLPFSHILSVATDTPFFPDELLARISQTILDADRHIGIAASGGRVHPTFGLWPVSLRSDLKHWLDDPANRRVTAWLQRHPHRVVEFPLVRARTGDPFDPFFNINTPADIAAARQHWKTAE